jgi:hypothetical protein
MDFGRAWLRPRIKVHYKITHFGTDSHADAPQELPVVYVNPIVSNFFYYAGN